jgi:tRNA dimethylallyltransferase
MAVYRGMDIGTAKPSVAERAGLAVRMIDLVDPSEDYTVKQFQQATRDVVAEMEGRHKRALYVGGTGLYLRAVTDDLELPGRWPDIAAALENDADTLGTHALHSRLEGLDPVAAHRIEPSNRRRLVRALEVTVGSGRPFSSFGPGLTAYPWTSIVQVGVPYDPQVHEERVAARFSELVERGLLEEVKRIAAQPGGFSRTARQAIGYKELLDHIENGTPFDVAVQAAVQRTRTLARRQWAWFRRDPRIDWMDPSQDLLEQLLSRWDAAALPAEQPPTQTAATRDQTPVGD